MKTSRFPELQTSSDCSFPFWENGQHSAIPSIEKQKVIVEEQRQRFADIENYQCQLSDKLRQLRDDLVQTNARRQLRLGRDPQHA